MLIMIIKGTPTIQATWKSGENAIVIRLALKKIIPIHCNSGNSGAFKYKRSWN
jgi:hypothetical protein